MRCAAENGRATHMFDALRERMVENADRVAIISDGEEHSFRSLTAAVAEREHVFRTAGVGQGDVVILVGEISFDPLVSLLALLFCKAAVIPLTRNAHAKLGPSVDRMGPDVLIDSFAGGAVERISREPSPDDDSGWRQAQAGLRSSPAGCAARG